MIGLGTIVNVGTVLIGTTIGILLKNGLPKRFEKTVMQGLGLTTCFIGIGGTLSEVLIIQDGEIGTQHTMLLILCLALGAVIGEALNIEQRLEDFGAFCQSHFAAKGDSRFVEGFVTASLLFCVGAMAIVGALNGMFYVKLRIPSMIVTTGLADCQGYSGWCCLDSLRRISRQGRIPVYCADFLLSRRHYIDGTIHPSLADRCLDWSNVVCRLRADFCH